MAEKERLSPDAEERLRAELDELRAEIKTVARGSISESVSTLDVGRDVSIAAPDDIGVIAEARNFRAPARGDPMSMTQDDVDQLARGETKLGLATRLASRPMVLATRPEGVASAAFGPVRLEASDIEAVATTGKTTASLKKALEAAAKSPGRFGEIKDAAESGKERPQIAPDQS